MTYSINLRHREIGIRMAIGAESSGVARMIMKQGLALAVAGVAAGILLWLLASRAILTFVEGAPFSWGLVALVAAGLLATAAVGAYIPARRASRIDPNEVLGQE
jgi:ABC-type antimicrobial peptide transport system permease subunit